MIGLVDSVYNYIYEISVVATGVVSIKHGESEYLARVNPDTTSVYKILDKTSDGGLILLTHRNNTKDTYMETVKLGGII